MKLREAIAAVVAGATEIDMVLNVPNLMAGDYVAVFSDIQAVRDACTLAQPKASSTSHDQQTRALNPVLKVILETSRLSRQQTVAGSLIARAAGADFVKTSTGFQGRGANVEDVQLMRSVVRAPWAKLGVVQEPERARNEVHVKASGGIRSLADALKMLQAGAERIGTSAGVRMLEEVQGGTDYMGLVAATENLRTSSY